MNAEQRVKVKRLQKNLMALRKFAGWSTTDLAELLGVTKQTISNLENENTEMSLVQYIAIRAILDDEIQRQKDNETLKVAVEVLLDDEQLSEEEQEELQKKSEFIATAMSSESQKKVGMKMALETFTAIAVATAAGVATKSPAAGASAWLGVMRALSGNDNRKPMVDLQRKKK